MYQELTHAEKFDQFIEACNYKDVDGFYIPIIVASLKILGDTVEEIEENIKIASKTKRIIYIADIDVKIDTCGSTK